MKLTPNMLDNILDIAVPSIVEADQPTIDAVREVFLTEMIEEAERMCLWHERVHEEALKRRAKGDGVT